MKRTLSTVLAAWLSGYLACAPVVAAAEDIDIFTGASGGTSVNPRVLIVIDNTSNWAAQKQQWPGGLQQGQSEVRSIKNLVATLDGSISMGLMEYVTGGNANDDGGFIRSAIRPLDTTAKANFSAQLDTIFNNITSPAEKKNSNLPYGNLMLDVYNYYAGGASVSPSAVDSAKADADGYSTQFSTFRSPLGADNNCGKNFVIFIGNTPSSGPTSDTKKDTTNTAKLNELAGTTVRQLGLPDFAGQNTQVSTNVATTAACYSPTDVQYPYSAKLQAELRGYAAQCSTYTEDCQPGAATANINPIACDAGTLSYSVVQSVYHPPVTTPGQPVQGTTTTTNGTTTGYYASLAAAQAAVQAGTETGGLTCPQSSTSTNGNTTTRTTYSCGAITVGAAVGTATTSTTSHAGTLDPNNSGTGCYKGVVTSPAAGYWFAGPPPTDSGGLTCPANSSCTYTATPSGNNGGCRGQGYTQYNITQSATAKQQYKLTMTVTPTTTSDNTTPATTTTTTLGKTSQCYASAPASTNDYAASCSGPNTTCTYNNIPTSNTLAVCPAGTSAYKIDGVNITMVDTPTGTTTVDSATYNADEWARLRHDKGVPVAGSGVRAPVATYTIDVYNKQQNGTQTSLLMSMAKAGGGKYFAAKNEQAILDALKQIIVEIQAVNTTFASTSLPVSATNRSQNENQVFIGMFRPDSRAKPRWFGNLKRYKLIANGADIELGDTNGNIATNSVTGFVTPCAASFWTSDSGSYWNNLGIDPDPAGTCATTSTDKYSDLPDGPQVEKGGAAEVLRLGNTGGASTSQAVQRNMYTVANDALATFNTANTSLSDSLVRFIRGEDVNDEKGTNTPTTTRPSIHGDVIHSRPLPVNYGSGTGVRVFYGANDGALHAIDAASGVEKWSLVAPEFFGRLQRLMDNGPLVSYPNLGSGITPTPTRKDYFFDGSIGLFQNADNTKVWIFPTMRRGGRMLYALDVTSADRPALKWRVGCPNLGDDTGCTAGMSGIGQTWSTPNVAFIRGYSTTKPVLVVGGGYDACEDADTASPSCSAAKGGAVYVLDADTGTLLQSFATERAVAADVSLVDMDGDGSPDYAYALDTGGNVYRIDFVGATAGGAKMALKDGSWTSRKVAFTANGGRKFLFGPALLPARNKVYLAMGSGDREHPLQANYPYNDVQNRFYVYLDDLAAAVGTPAVDLDKLGNNTNANDCATTQVLPESGLKGWFIDLKQYGKGEQTVTSALITGGMAVFSTNRPIPPDNASCSTSLGQARGYWVNLFNGSGGLNTAGTCGGDRSSVFVGGGLPPSPTKAAGVDVNGRSVTVVFGAGRESPIAPRLTRPSISYKRTRVYKATSGD
jgi:Tfp pilus tip-associated adhesin PilY1